MSTKSTTPSFVLRSFTAILLLATAFVYGKGFHEDPPASHYKADQVMGFIGFQENKGYDNPSDNLFTITINEDLASDQEVWLVYDVKGVANANSVSRSINDRLSVGGSIIQFSENWSTQRERIDASWLKKGINRVLFSSDISKKVGYQIKNLRIEKGTSTHSQNTLLFSHDGKVANNSGYAYFRGFIKGRDYEGARLWIDGKEVHQHRGEFEVLLKLAPNASFKKELIIQTLSGKEKKQEINIVSSPSPANQIIDLDYHIKSIQQAASKNSVNIIALGSATLEIGKEVLKKDELISVTTLRQKDIPSLDLGMVNVTADFGGYRFLPHGQLFEKEATVKIKVDKAKLPSGYTLNDVKTYYFDLDSKHWKELKKDSIDYKNGIIISKTNHFTDMINGVIKAPESPETSGYSPTMMNDMKAADPSAGVQVISAPSANAQGSANINYSIEVPPGRQGMNPQLGISYSSDGGNGWLGLGWNLNTPSITVDTRWGVPRYKNDIETETYLLGGSMLVGEDKGNTFVAHRDYNIARVADRRFYKRNEGDFNKIIRLGSSPSNYYWVITSKDGTKYYYGGINGLDTSAVLQNPQNGNIAEWYLTKVEDIDGNYITYEYRVHTENVFPSNSSIQGRNVYLSKVNYTGRGADKGMFSLNFNLSDQTRKDNSNSARYGFFTINPKLLDNIVVMYNSEKVRSYKMEYKEGKFNKTILTAITQLKPDDSPFNRHDFEYYDDIDGKEIISSQKEVFNTQNDNIKAGFISSIIPGFEDNASGIGGSLTKTYGVNASISAGVYNGDGITKSGTIGAGFSYSSSTTEGMVALVDINGDALADKVYIKGGKMYYRPNVTKTKNRTLYIGAENSNTIFGEEHPIQGGPQKFSYTKSSSTGFGPKAYIGFAKMTATVGFDRNNGTSTTKTYFADVNGDGLVDVINNGKVYFNSIKIEKNADGSNKLIPTFTLDSNNTPSPINGGGNIDSSVYVIDPVEQQALIDNSPLHDVVRVWEAPFAGIVNIASLAQLKVPDGDYDVTDYEKADGVYIQIQHNASVLFPATKIDKGGQVAANASAVNVLKGDKIYFRLQSGLDNNTSNGAFDLVNWNPEIAYTTLPNANELNANGLKSYSYKADEGFIVETEYANLVPQKKGEKGSVLIKGHFKKPLTTDDVSVKIQATDENGNWKEVWCKTFLSTEVFDKELAASFTLPALNSDEKQHTVKIMLHADTNVDWKAIKWDAELLHYKQGDYALVTPPSPTVESCTGFNAVALNNGVAAVYTAIPVIDYGIFTEELSKGEAFVATAESTIVTPTVNFSLPPNYTGNKKITISVKKSGALISKKTITANIPIGSTTYSLPVTPITFTSKAGEKYWVEAFIDDNTFGGSIEAHYTSGLGQKPMAVFQKRSDEKFGPMYRHWGQFVYDASQGRAIQPIKQDLLKYQDNPNPSDGVAFFKGQVFIPMVAKMSKGVLVPYMQVDTQWQGLDNLTYVKNTWVSASRLGEDNVVLTNPLAGLGGAASSSGAFGIDKVAKNFSNITMLGASFITISKAKGEQRSITDFMDLNGDRYPDILVGKNIQYTSPFGNFSGESITHNFNNHLSFNQSTSAGIGGAPIPSKSVASAEKAYNAAVNDLKGASFFNFAVSLVSVLVAEKSLEKARSSSLVPTGNLGVNESEDHSVDSWMDVNGDGLIDKVFSTDGGGSFKVAYNMGYGFSEPVSTSMNALTVGKGTSLSAGLGFDYGSSSISAGFGLNKETGVTQRMMEDINGDGLPDLIWVENGTLYSKFNLGNTFSDTVTTLGNIKELTTNASTAESLNANFSVNVPILGVKFSVGIGGNTGRSMSRPETLFADIDGDGYLDYLNSEKDGEIIVKRSTIARTNKLKTVKNPIKGSFTVDYAHSPASYYHPGGKWVMSSVQINDGLDLDNDGADKLVSIYTYDEGRYDRHEREFLGFGKVRTHQVDAEKISGNLPDVKREDLKKEIYRTSEQQFLVEQTTMRTPVPNTGTKEPNYYYQGIPWVERLYAKDDEANIFSEKEYEYYNFKIPAPSADYARTESTLFTHNSIFFKPLKYSVSSVFEGDRSNKYIAEESFFNNYDQYGHPLNYVYSNEGTLKTSGYTNYNYQTAITYDNNPLSYILGMPKTVKVSTPNLGVVRRTEADNNTQKGQIDAIRSYLDDARFALSKFVYNDYGNIIKKTLPENSKGEQMSYQYDYDKYNYYIRRVTDAFGYQSFTGDYDINDNGNYDYRFGIPLQNKDINGNETKFTIDNIGRVVTVKGPNELFNKRPYTIKFEYHPFDRTNPNHIPYAVTKHFDPQNIGNDLETVSFIDGMGRAVQVKKDAVITTVTNATTNPMQTIAKEGFIVSGRQTYDGLGRVKASYQPITEELSQKAIINKAADTAVPPTETMLDVLDRSIAVKEPDNSSQAAGGFAETKIEYGFGNDKFGARRMKTKMIDALGNYKETLAKGGGLTTTVDEYDGTGKISTGYTYDGINQLRKVVDTKDNAISSEYDNFGRRTKITHPDAGTTTLTYDLLNLVKRQTANLGAIDKTIDYEYEFSRLTHIKYPQSPKDNVRYYFGNKNADNNRKGRLILQEDGTGAQEFFYGKQGEIIKNTRTLIIPNNELVTYTTEWEYDSWNRLQNIKYPDQEKVKYTYNTGGLLESVIGYKGEEGQAGSIRYDYIDTVGYDKFEQRSYLKYGNSTETAYTYEPDRRRLKNMQAYTGTEGGIGTRRQFMNNAYTYDKVSNVLRLANTAPLPQGQIGGGIVHTYVYDKLYRLASAQGSYNGNVLNVKGTTTTNVPYTAGYKLEMAYDQLHNITAKKQYLQRSATPEYPTGISTGYELKYTYKADQPHQVEKIEEAGYREENNKDTPQAKDKSSDAYKYDKNGNLIYINTTKIK